MENMNEENEQRIDTAFRYIKAPADKIYKALTIPAQLLLWKAPKGMRMEIFHFNFRVEGTYRLALYYNDRSQPGKAGNNSDIVLGRFIELISNRKITEAVHFQSTDPSFAGEMIMTTELEPEKGGTKVIITATHVPLGISVEDHLVGMESSLANLALFTE